MKSKEALTSVIITCHNYGRFLEECAESVLKQTIKAKEIIIINDASDDDTEDVALSFGEQIKYYRVDFKNAQKTRNFGLSKSMGKYVVFLDADDYFRDDYIKKTQKVMELNSEIYLVYTDRKNIGEKKYLDKINLDSKCKFPDFDYEKLKHGNFISLPSLIRKEKFFGFDEQIERYQDWDAWLTFLKNGKQAVHVSEALVYVRFHGTNLTFNFDDNLQKLKILIKHGFQKVIIDDYYLKITQQIKQKDQQIKQKDQQIKQKDQQIKQKDQQFQRKEKIIQQKNRQIKIMQSSRFWKIREKYLQAQRFFKK